MNDGEGQNPADQLANPLAAYDDLLAVGQREPTKELEKAVDPALLADWDRLTAFLMLVEQAWPRANEGSASPTEIAPVASMATASKLDGPVCDANRRFGRFQILGTLGQGGFGIVFLAWDPAPRRQVALKVPQPETLMTPELRKRFQREAHAAAGLDHPNIVPVYETGTVGSVTYIAAAFCPGPTLTEWLARQSHPVPVREAVRLVATLARAVGHAHEREVLHRDLKPSNILLTLIAVDDLLRDENEALGAFQPALPTSASPKLPMAWGPKPRVGFRLDRPPIWHPSKPRVSSRRSAHRPTSTRWVHSLRAANRWPAF